MPVTESAIKTLRKDQRRTIINQRLEKKIKRAIRGFRKQPTIKKLVVASSALDRAVKKKFIHKNKAARLKSRLTKLL